MRPRPRSRCATAARVLSCDSDKGAMPSSRAPALSIGVDRRSGDGAPEDPLPSVARDTPSKRQARTLAADLEGVLGKGVESRAQQDIERRETWPEVPAPRRKSEEQIFAAIRAAQPYGASPIPPSRRQTRFVV